MSRQISDTATIPLAEILIPDIWNIKQSADGWIVTSKPNYARRWTFSFNSVTCQQCYMSTVLHINSVTCQQCYMSTVLHVNSVTCQQCYMSTVLHVNSATCQQCYMSTVLHVNSAACQQCYMSTSLSSFKSFRPKSALNCDRLLFRSYTITHCLIHTIQYNIILPSTSGSTKWLLPFMFCNWQLTHTYISLPQLCDMSFRYRATYLTNLMILVKLKGL